MVSSKAARNLQAVIDELRRDRQRIDNQIEHLEQAMRGLGEGGSRPVRVLGRSKSGGKKVKRYWSPASRKAAAERMRKYWAERRKAKQK